MAEISAEIIKSAVVKRLKEAYPKITIYKERVKQGMKLPCFFVLLIHSMDSQKLGSRSLRDYLVHVRYHSQAGTQAELNEIGDHLAGLLRQVELSDGPILGRVQSWDIQDGILTFRIRFKLYVDQSATREESMEGLDLKEGIKGE